MKGESFALKGQYKVSYNGYKLLPNSLRNIADSFYKEYFPLTINELANTHILLVNRGDTEIEGKDFRLDDFVKIDSVEVWIRKEELQ
ncbi:hypothetical protein CCY99_08875 [Helicobacter sp. 16-1353]|uniref:hypothetical protein n=1 Tax=Helicobacter sp. 16-1353 TaxID=2004996 RepID=UPI000DCCA0FC|nr:hypothetical protein [Helicobacter sp. 16-1353]RAX51564.1 hypothetical protein CCY99_08875 [Helicobacter sp. 16-1353]